MTDLDALLTWPTLALVLAIVVVAGLAHGTMGFGFPVISTPMVALVTDVKTAVVATLLPNLAVNLVSIVRGGQWRGSIGKHWPVAVYVLIGALVDTRLLLVANPAPIKLLLAMMIVVYLEQGRLRGIDWTWLHRYPRAAALVSGLLGGVLSGTVNVALPPLLIYFMALELPAVALTQVLNLCFFVGRTSQVAAFGVSGRFGVDTSFATLPLTAAALAALAAGLALQRRLPRAVYARALRYVLWAIALMLASQVVWQPWHA